MCVCVCDFRPSVGRSAADGTLTAANLIDAIITHQINQTSSDPPITLTRDGHRPAFVSVFFFFVFVPLFVQYRVLSQVIFSFHIW